MKGKCNCGKKATVEFLIYFKNGASTMKYCKGCEPKEHYNLQHMAKIDGK